MILKKISADHPDYSKVKNLYETAFPIDERPMSMDEIMAITETMSAEVLGIYPDDAADDFSGFFVIFDAGDFVYLNFFATSPEKRSSGIGSKAIKALIVYCNEKPLLFDYESPFEASDNTEQRERRRSFYLKNGFNETGWFLNFNDTEFIITSSKENFDKAVIEQFAEIIAANFPDAAVKPELYSRDDI